ncbi:HAD family hydrolase [Candidatus Woesearchaeota archaeon]|nr:HAD family hydrolase [Candidatus Woesearchaeota archaeon]
MDNTLVDADKAHLLAYNKAFKKNNLSMVADKELKIRFGKLGKLIVHELFPSLSWDKVNKIMEDHHRIIMNESKKCIKPFPGVKSTLKKLHKKYRIAVISNGRHSEIVAVLKAAGFDPGLFALLVGSDEVEHAKPYPDEIFKAERMLCMKASYMVGDTVYDIIAGKRAGVKAIAVLTGNHTREMLEKENPDYIINSIKDLPKVLG